MTRPVDAPGFDPYEGPGATPEPVSEITLRPLLRILWRYRRIIVGSVAFVGAVSTLVLVTLFFSLPIERTARVGFRLLFDGAAKGRYPNQLRFSATDIVEAPILKQVFATDGLSSYGSYEEFKGAIHVLHWSPQLEFLAYEYESRLADARLTPVERTRIEEEYRDKQQSITDPSYVLELRRSERFQRMPRELTIKVLQDILMTWSHWARDRKGAFNYSVPVLSTTFLGDLLQDHEQPFIGLDILRSKTLQIIDNLDAVLLLPGAVVVRSGAEKLSLTDVRARLDHILRFELQPALATDNLRDTGERQAIVGYIDRQLLQLRVKREEVQGRIRAIQEPLREYVQRGPTAVAERPRQDAGGNEGTQAVTLSDSFLERLVDLSNSSNDAAYRQLKTDEIMTETRVLARIQSEISYYDELLESVKGGGSTRPVMTAQEARARLQTSHKNVATALGQFTALYEALSVENLSPSTELYEITSPFSMQSVRALTLRQIVMYDIIIVFAAM